MNHEGTIRQQIVKNTDVRKQDRLDYLEEGTKARAKIENEREKILRIKQQKLANIEKMGIDPKY
jgi:hypothetical protein